MSTVPFHPTSTPAMDRANRLISVKGHPGFLEILRLSQELVDTAQAISTDFGGWDPQQIVVLKIRAQAAKEHHAALIAKIHEAIAAGIAEGNAVAATLPEKTPTEMIEQGDYVRQEMLKKFDEMEGRTAGSY